MPLNSPIDDINFPSSSPFSCCLDALIVVLGFFLFGLNALLTASDISVSFVNVIVICFYSIIKPF